MTNNISCQKEMMSLIYDAFNCSSSLLVSLNKIDFSMKRHHQHLQGNSFPETQFEFCIISLMGKCLHEKNVAMKKMTNLSGSL